MANFYDNSLTTKVTGSVRVEQFTVPLPITGTVSAKPVPTGNVLQKSVTATTSSVTLVQANTARKSLWVYNYGSSHLCVSLNQVANSGTDYFLRIEPDGYWELPVALSVYTGVVSGIWEPGSPLSGSAKIVELR